ncbi:hypothetical protein C8R46DRAFT_1209005 [Mycena filopes]|nr:hypothetical protein C8R46DRAFT_1209005 [Mycena filopes]
MHSLPVEVLERIFALADTNDVRALFQVSRLLRSVTAWELLSRYDLSMTQIYSGKIHLSTGTYFLIPNIYRIHPIRELVVPADNRCRLELLAVITSRFPIPRVCIFGEISQEDKPWLVICAMSRNGQDPIVFVGRDIVLSLPCRIIPFKERLWESPATEVALDKLSAWIYCIGTSCPGFCAYPIFWCIAFAIPLVLILIFDLIYKAWVLMDWLYQYLFAPPLDPSVRIAADMARLRRKFDGELSRWSSMIVQTVPTSDNISLTLVTIRDHRYLRLRIRPIPELSSAMWTSVLHSLDFDPSLRDVTVTVNAALPLSPFLAFLRLHSDRQIALDVELEPGALSIPHKSNPYAQRYHLQSIRAFTAPAAYISPLLAGGCRFQRLTLTTTDDLSEVLNALAAQEDSELHTLKLQICHRAQLPWNTNEHGDVEAPAVPSVGHIVLDFSFRCRAADLDGFSHWLARFPALAFVHVFGQELTLPQRTTLSGEISLGRDAPPWWAIIFHDGL